jgi:hypothetical protein
MDSVGGRIDGVFDFHRLIDFFDVLLILKTGKHELFAAGGGGDVFRSFLGKLEFFFGVVRNAELGAAMRTLAGFPFEAGRAVELVAVGAEEDEHFGRVQLSLAAPLTDLRSCRLVFRGRLGGFVGNCFVSRPGCGFLRRFFLLLGTGDDEGGVALGAFPRSAREIIGSRELMAVGTKKLDRHDAGCARGILPEGSGSPDSS